MDVAPLLVAWNAVDAGSLGLLIKHLTSHIRELEYKKNYQGDAAINLKTLVKKRQELEELKATCTKTAIVQSPLFLFNGIASTVMLISAIGSYITKDVSGLFYSDESGLFYFFCGISNFATAAMQNPDFSDEISKKEKEYQSLKEKLVQESEEGASGKMDIEKLD